MINDFSLFVDNLYFVGFLGVIFIGVLGEGIFMGNMLIYILILFCRYI